nr:hypothetical protein [Mycobacterium sp.]
MTRPGGHDDPLALERAAREFHAIAQSARAQAGHLDKHAGKVRPVAHGVTSIIGGTASGTDKKMIGTLDRALRDLQDASRRLNESAQAAEQLAREATGRALSAREAQAAAQSARRR